MSEVQPPNIFREGLARSIEGRIEVDRVRHTKQNAADLFKNSSDVFGAGDSDKGSEVALRVLSKYERAKPYRSFEDIKVACNDPNGNKKVAEADRRSIVESIFMAMNGSVLGVEGLVTDQMSAEDIDSVLPSELKGVGEFVKKIELTSTDETGLTEINKTIEDKKLFSSEASDEDRGRYFSELGRRKDAPGSITEMYVEMQRDMLKNIGVELDDSSKIDAMTVLGDKVVDAAGRMGMAVEKVGETIEKMDDFFETGSERGVIRGLRKGEDTPKGIERDRFKKAMEEAMSRAGTEMKHRYLPKDKEGRMEWVEERLNMIERYKTRSIKNELALSDWMYPLQEFMSITEDSSDPEILEMRKMINTRLTLKAMGDALGRVSGSLDDRQGMFAAIKELKENGFDLTPEIMEAFFRNELHGFKTAEAWDMMEKANFHYDKMVEEVLSEASDDLKSFILKEFGSFENFSKMKPLPFSKNTRMEGKYWNYFLETQGSKMRASIVRKYMIEKLQKMGVDGYHAEKSLRMAEFLYDAVGESSVVDWDFVNGDDYAELINLGYLRWIDGQGADKGKREGAPFTVGRIDHVAVGWLRFISSEKDPTQMILSETIVNNGLTYRINDGWKERGIEGKKQFVPYFTSITEKKLLPAKQLICSSETPDKDKVLIITYFEGVNDAFNKVDADVAKKGEKDSIKTMWLAGLIQLALTHPDSKWTPSDFFQLKYIVTKQPMRNMSEESIEAAKKEGRKPLQTFITDEQWNWIERELNLSGYARADAIANGMGGFFNRLGGKR